MLYPYTREFVFKYEWAVVDKVKQECKMSFLSSYVANIWIGATLESFWKVEESAVWKKQKSTNHTNINTYKCRHKSLDSMYIKYALI